jgi:hypothetical protein
MTTLSEAAAWHEQRATNLRADGEKLFGMGVPIGQHRKEQIAMHVRFAQAIREADTDEPVVTTP